ncbi:MAG: acyl carrier protein [Gordonia sp. (in: high G+C Gram-positive bacteria)]|uniref:acyl carrier protein n=1 Tax=Gordonia sp. (in: high G+C Gram-positive bacteria) TaxID=84139 RepID=UPI0039E69D24
MSDHVENVLKEILVGDLDLSPDDVSGESRLVEDLGLDSVGFAIGVVAIEERLGVKLTEREMLETSTVDDLETLVRSRLAPADAGV